MRPSQLKMKLTHSNSSSFIVLLVFNPGIYTTCGNIIIIIIMTVPLDYYTVLQLSSHYGFLLFH